MTVKEFIDSYDLGFNCKFYLYYIDDSVKTDDEYGFKRIPIEYFEEDNFLLNQKVVHWCIPTTDCYVEIMIDNPMKKKHGKLALHTVESLSAMLYNNLINGKWVDCDYCITDIPLDIYNKLNCNYFNLENIYGDDYLCFSGIKNINKIFSPCDEYAIIYADYYGGGHMQALQLYEDSYCGEGWINDRTGEHLDSSSFVNVIASSIEENSNVGEYMLLVEWLECDDSVSNLTDDTEGDN